jgi:hypothetical protein
MRHRRHRQERWLHTRISEELADALKEEARRRRTPISLLVRHVLENALNLVEDIVADGIHIARAAGNGDGGIGNTPDPTGLEDVYGWQELVINRSATCARCSGELAAGTKAHRGLSERPGAPVFLCATCIRQLRRADTETAKEEAAQ